MLFFNWNFYFGNSANRVAHLETWPNQTKQKNIHITLHKISFSLVLAKLFKNHDSSRCHFLQITLTLFVKFNITAYDRCKQRNNYLASYTFTAMTFNLVIDILPMAPLLHACFTFKHLYNQHCMRRICNSLTFILVLTPPLLSPLSSYLPSFPQWWLYGYVKWHLLGQPRT